MTLERYEVRACTTYSVVEIVDGKDSVVELAKDKATAEASAARRNCEAERTHRAV
jgi:hypothetical protein